MNGGITHIAPWLMLLFATQAVCDPAPWEDQIGPCQDILNVVEAQAIPLTGEHCPALTQALADSQWAELFATTMEQDLAGHALADLAGYIATYRSAPPGPDIDLDRLDTIVADLPREVEASPSLSDRLWRWVADFFDEQLGESSLSWLKDLSIPEGMTRVSLYIISGLIVAAGLGVIYNEVRLARRGVRQSRPIAQSPQDGSAISSLADLNSIPLTDRPAAILTIVLERLGRFPESFTHREIVRATSGIAQDQHKGLTQLSQAAERLRYGRWQPTEKIIENIVNEGIDLADQVRSE